MPIALVGGLLIVGNGGPARPESTVLIQGTKIVEVSQQRDFCSDVRGVNL